MVETILWLGKLGFKIVLSFWVAVVITHPGEALGLDEKARARHEENLVALRLLGVGFLVWLWIDAQTIVFVGKLLVGIAVVLFVLAARGLYLTRLAALLFLWWLASGPSSLPARVADSVRGVQVIQEAGAWAEYVTRKLGGS